MNDENKYVQQLSEEFNKLNKAIVSFIKNKKECEMICKNANDVVGKINASFKR